MSDSQSIGSLVIDLRANVAQLQADMNDVKNLVQKSSSEMSGQMRRDMNETRQTLALLREDIGIGIPRELRTVIASSELARDAILGIRTAMVGLAFFNIGMEAISKLMETFKGDTEQAAKKAEEAAKAEKDFIEAIKLGNAEHEERLRLIGLIGKTQEDVFKSNLEHNQQLIRDQKTLIDGMIAEINAKQIQLIQARQAVNPNNRGALGPGNVEANLKEQQDAFNAFVEKIEKPLIEAQNKLQALEDEGLRLTKQREEDKRQEQKKTFDDQQKQYQQALTTLAEFQRKEMDTLDPLQKAYEEWDQIRATQAKIIDQHDTWEIRLRAAGTLAAEIAATTKIINELDKQAAEALARSVTEMEKLQKAQGNNPIVGLMGSLTKGGAPQFQADMVGAAIQRFAGNFKDAQAQSKLLEQAMDALLTPMDKFRIMQEEVNLLMARPEFKNSPEVIKALKDELLKANPEFQKLQQASAEFGHDLANELDQLILHGKSFSDVLKQIALDIAEIALKAELLKPLEDFFSGGKSGTGGFLGLIGGLFGGFHAYGGAAAAGQVSVVGENGPELVVPNSNSTVIPNSSLGGVTNIFNIDARGAAPGSELAIIRGINKALEQNVQRSRAAMIDYQRRR
jgi:hypothetical protein